ncbi:MAG: BatA domain-containing protein [Ignavibacteria bacterium]|nr:BatA domain-containing protein [Ignavibacteria bacterium]
MTFLNPLVLLGLAAAAIPVLLHLLNLRKLKTIEFSSLRFLKELQKTKIRRLKLRQIILLILRTMIIIFSVLAFSRPAVKSSLPGLGTHAKTSVVILLDNSFSMDASDEGGNRFKQAKNSALSILSALKDGDEAILLPMSVQDEKHPSFSRNFTLLKEEITKLPIASTTAKLETAMRLASTALEASNNINREVYLITDAQRNIFAENLKDSVRSFDDRVAVFAVPIGRNASALEQNISIDTVSVLTRIFQPEKPVEVEARLRNSSAKAASGVVVSMLFNGERVAQRTVDIPAGEVRSVQIAAPPQKRGITKATIEIEGDALDQDNRRYFGFSIPAMPTVALIGAPQNVKFISLLLGDNQSATVTTIAPQDISGVNFGQYDAVIIAGGLRQSEADRLDGYIQNGGGALVFADGTIEPAAFTAAIARLGFSGVSEQSFSNEQPAGFTSVDKQHPLFQGVFKGTTDSKAVVESPKITKALPASGGQALISMAGGAFLAESKHGEGKIIYCAVPPSTEWSNFPFTGIFPTMLYRSLVYLTMREGLGAEVTAGIPLTLTLPKRFAAGGNFKILDVNNTEFFRQAALLPSGAALPVGNLQQLGVYQIFTADGKPVTTVAVNFPSSEGLLSFLSKDEFDHDLKGKISPKAVIEWIDNPQNVVASVARARIGSELWKACLIAALLCAIAEMLVARATKNDVNGE